MDSSSQLIAIMLISWATLEYFCLIMIIIYFLFLLTNGVYVHIYIIIGF